MTRVILCLVTASGILLAQEQAAFRAPQAYDVQRYQAGWNTNPFTLKTAPVVVETVSFAKDLAIGTYYGDASNPTVVIVNTKTNERISLKKDQPASNGMKLDSVKIGPGRKDVTAKVTLGTETSELRISDSYVKQMAAAEVIKGPAVQQQVRQPPGAPLKMPMPQPPVQQIGSPRPAPPVTTFSPVPPGQQAAVSQPGPAHLHVPAVNGAENAVEASRVNGVQASSPPNAVSQSSTPSTPPVPARRRLIAPSLNPAATAQ